MTKGVVCIWDCCASFDETALSVFFVLPFFSFFPTFFSSLRLTDRELRNDLKKQDNFSMKVHLFCRKVVHFCPNVPHFLEGMVGRERKMKHFLHRWAMNAKKRLPKTPIRISFHCMAINLYLCRVIVILLFNLLHDLLCRRSFSSYVFPNKFRFPLVEARSPLA